MSDNGKEKVTLTAKDFNEANLKKYEMSETLVEIPELNRLLGLDTNSVAVVKVRQLELDEFLKIQGTNADHIKTVLDGIVYAAGNKDLVAERAEKAMKQISSQTRQVIDTIEVGLTEPKLDRAVIIKMSRMWPMGAWKIYNLINLLTSRGADLKKNSTD